MNGAPAERGRWREVSALFDAVAELAPEARRAVLAAQPPEIRAEVELLLSADARAELRQGALLDDSAAALAAPWLFGAPGNGDLGDLPARIDHFVLVGELGRGGMGRVLRARDERLERDVAIKIVSDLADPEARDNLLREARAASGLRHPRIVTVHDVGRSGALDYIVLELVEGTSLAANIPPGGLPIARAVLWAQQVAEALAHAHAHGVIHRDLKAANVMITPEGAAKVLDFGIAKRLSTEAPPTATPPPALGDEAQTTLGSRFGTPAAMSPEQALAAPVDARSDVFSFGSLLYEMLTGKSAFRRASAESTRQAVLEEQPPPVAASRGIPRRLARLLEACLAKDPLARPTDGAALLAELRRVSAELSGARTRRLLALGAVLVLVVTAALFWVWPRPRLAGPERFALLWDDASGHAQSGPSLSPDGLRLAFVQPDEREIPQVWTRAVGGGPAIMLTHGERPVGRPHWLPGSEAILFDVVGGGIWRVPAAGGPATQVLAHGHDAAPSRDGTRLVFDDAGALSVAAADGTGARQIAGIAPQFWSQNRAPAFSPDGRTVAYFQAETGPYGDLWLADVERGGTRRLTFDAAQGGDPVWTPDGKSIVYASSRGGPINLWRLDLGDSRLTPVTRGSGDDRQATISADGRRLLFATARDSYALMALDPATGVQRTLVDRRIPITHPSFSPDGKDLVYFSVDRMLFRIGRDPAAGEPRRLSLPDEIAILPEWSADGEHIDYYGREPEPGFRTMNPDGAGRAMLLPGWEFEIQHGAMLDPARRRVVYTAMHGATPTATFVRDLASGAEHALAQPVLWPRWSPNGTSLAGRALDRSLVVCDAAALTCRRLSERGSEPRWVDGGRALYFVRYIDLFGPQDEATELWKVNADGTGERRIGALPGARHPLHFFYDAARDGSVVWCSWRPGTREIWSAELP